LKGYTFLGENNIQMVIASTGFCVIRSNIINPRFYLLNKIIEQEVNDCFSFKFYWEQAYPAVNYSVFLKILKLRFQKINSL
jgi:hypothetical protein